MASLLERFKRLMPVASIQNELHESDERTVNHEEVRLNAVTKEGSANLEPTTAKRSFVNPQSTPASSDTISSSNSSRLYDNQTTLEPHSNWRALQQSIPECLELIRKDEHLIAWLEYRTHSKCWVSTPPVSADQQSLAALAAQFAAAEPDALIVAIKSARGLHPEINPARQEVAQRARFSLSVITA